MDPADGPGGWTLRMDPADGPCGWTGFFWKIYRNIENINVINPN